MNMQIARLNNHRPSKKKDGREASCKAQAQEEGKIPTGATKIDQNTK